MLMASTSHNSTPSSYASTLHPTIWDVFLSFRGIDTRDSFTDFLYHSLDRKGIRTFRDDPELRSGEVISEALLQAIHNSKIYVVVLSKNYASSQWCLEELVEILGCYGSMDRLVIPVFYYIQPSVAKYQTGSFDEAFRKHENRFDGDRLDKWRVTLKKVGGFSGYHVGEYMSQVDVINKIVDRVLHEVNPVTLNVAKYQVGLDSRVKEVETLWSNVTTSVIRIGIYGMGGVGKTTLAKALYNQNYSHFEGSCFLENVREASQTRKGITCLQQKLVNDVLRCKNITIDNADHGIELIRARICSSKILVVIDDLDSRMTLDFIEGPFALGSTIIITTRHEDLLDSIDVEARYKVNELGDVESRLLFCQHAFGGDNKIPDTFSDLSKEILKRAGGLPLALKVCGSALHKESEEGWRCIIDQMKRVSIVDVDKILLISFNALVDPMLKDIFLDIACFFIGYKQDDAVRIMETYYTFVNYNIEKLKKRCLITINDKRFMMHDLLRDMSRKIARNNSPDAPENHSRLWVPEIIHEVLEEKKGTEAIEGIIPIDYDLPGNSRPSRKSIFGQKSLITASKGNFDDFDLSENFDDFDLLENLDDFDLPENFDDFDDFITASKGKDIAAETFKRMSKLRFLHLRNVNLTGSFKHAFKDLRWLSWEGCSLECLPSDFNPQKLVFLALTGSELKTMWKFNTAFENLKTLDMSYSWNLTTAQGFERLPCLETLNLKGSERLEEVHILTGSLLRLVSLNLGGCRNLKSLPDNICNLKALKSLNIDGCVNLKALPAELGNLESLVSLNARALSNIPELPASIRRIGSLENLMLSYCFNLLSVGGLASSLKVISLQGCKAMERLPNLSNLKQLERFDLTNCSGLREIQGLEELTSIRILNLGGCNLSLLKSILTKRFFQIYSGFGHHITVFAPSSVFPDWINQSLDWIGKTEFPKISQSTFPHWHSDSRMILYLPLNRSHNFLAMILCSKFSRNGVAVSSVETATNTFGWNSVFETSPSDGNNDFSCMEIVPRKLFSVTDDDSNIVFDTRLDFYDYHSKSSGYPEILGIHLLYKLERHSSKWLKPGTDPGGPGVPGPP